MDNDTQTASYFDTVGSEIGNMVTDPKIGAVVLFAAGTALVVTGVTYAAKAAAEPVSNAVSDAWDWAGRQFTRTSQPAEQQAA